MGPVAEHGVTRGPQHVRSPSGDHYFEDVEPRFTDNTAESAMPSALLAGRPTGEIEPPPFLKIPGENAGDGPGSPAISDISQGSHFTSISERPVNPNWPRTAPPPPAVSRGPRVQDVVLDANPDFELPVAGRGRGGGARYGRGRTTPVGKQYP